MPGAGDAVVGRNRGSISQGLGTKKKQSHQSTHWPCTGWFFIIICAAHKLFIVSDFPKKITVASEASFYLLWSRIWQQDEQEDDHDEDSDAFVVSLEYVLHTFSHASTKFEYASKSRYI